MKVASSRQSIDPRDVLKAIAGRSAPFDAYAVYARIEGIDRETDDAHYRGNPGLCREVYAILDRLAAERKIRRVSAQRSGGFLEGVPADEFASNPAQRKALKSELGRLRGEK